MRVRSVILPPSLIASRALTTRLTITCSNWLRSAFTSQRSRPYTTSSWIVSPTSRRSSICSSDRTSLSCSVCGRKRLAAREREQLPHQPRRPIGVLLDLHDVLEGRIGRAVIGEQEIGIADDRGQHIVEVMRDAAGELADRLHLLALRRGSPAACAARWCRARRWSRSRPRRWPDRRPRRRGAPNAPRLRPRATRRAARCRPCPGRPPRSTALKAA